MFEVTVTRRRPQTFDDLAGQEFVAETLKNSLQADTIAHAYLFSGPRGCGKTSTARILAKTLNCTGEVAPCGVCPHCQEIAKGTSLDVIEIDGASNTSVNDVRQIKDEVLFPPNSSRYKIYIIDEVHMLSTSAFNALLKTIEEPPPYVVFIFATTELQKVPATIKSRCQQFYFRLVSVEQLKELLRAAAQESGVQADEEALFWIAREATGSVRDAYTLFDQVASFSGDHITYEKIRDTLGLVGIDRLNELFSRCAQGDTSGALNQLDAVLQSGVAIEQFISDSADYVRSLLFIKHGVTKESLLGNAAARYDAAVCAAWNAVQLERALSLFLSLYRDVRYSLSPRYELELAFARLCWLSAYVSPADVKQAIDAAQALLDRGSSSAVPVPETAALETGIDLSVKDSEMNGVPQFSALSSASAAAQPPGAVPLPFSNVVPPRLEATPKTASGTHSAPVEEIDRGGASPESAVPSSFPLNTNEPDSPSDTTAFSAAAPASTVHDDDDDWDLENDALDDSAVPDGRLESFATQPQSAEQTYTTAEGRVITLSQMRGTVIANLSVTDGMTASVLMQTKQWTLSNDTVHTEIGMSYQHALLQQKTPVITAVLQSLCGRPVGFSVELREEPLEQTPGDIPSAVKIVQDVFKGTIEGR